MQGRLSSRPARGLEAFPHDTWQDEFVSARGLALDSIEWSFGAEEALRNPLVAAGGRHEIRRRVNETGVQIRSVRADYFMVHRVAGESRRLRAQNVRMLEDVIRWTHDVGGRRVVIPFIHTATLSSRLLRDEAIESLRSALCVAEYYGVNLALELDLAGHEHRKFVSSCQSHHILAGYDTGSSTARGYWIEQDVEPLIPVLDAVYISDRKIGGGSVMLGDGDAHLESFLRRAISGGFEGDFVLRAFFGSDPVADARENVTYFRTLLAKAGRREEAA
jgi:L-ribulose-5-phosphate 3-epimerase